MALDVWIVECRREDFPGSVVESTWSTQEAAADDARARALRPGTWSCHVTRCTVDDPRAI